MNLPSKAVPEFSFLLFVLLLLHFVSSFPFLIYKQLVRKEVFPVVAWNNTNLRAPRRDFTVVERARSKFNFRKPFKSFPRIWNFSELKIPKYELQVSLFSKWLITCHGSLISIGQLTMCGTWAEVPWSLGCYSRGAGFRAGGFLFPPPPPFPRFFRSPARTALLKNPRWRSITERNGFSAMKPPVTACKQANWAFNLYLHLKLISFMIQQVQILVRSCYFWPIN